MPIDSSTDLGPNAYAAYGRATAYRTHDGRPMPMWEALGDTIQGAWRAVAAEIVAYLADVAQEDAATELASEPQRPTIGRIVQYTLTEADAAAIQKRRTDAVATANMTAAGQTYPAIVVRTFGGPAANLQVLLDGPDTYWATSRAEGEGPGFWAWPPRV